MVDLCRVCAHAALLVAALELPARASSVRMPPRPRPEPQTILAAAEIPAGYGVFVFRLSTAWTGASSPFIRWAMAP